MNLKTGLRVFNCFKGLAIYLSLTFGLSWLFSMIKTTNFWLNNLLNLLVSLITCIVLVYVYRDTFTQKLQDYKDNRSQYLKMIFKYWLCGFILMVVTNTILINFSGSIASNEEQNRQIIKELPFYALISTTILAPITEEIVFRASFKDLSTNKNVCAVVSGILFGLMHVIFNGDFIFIIPYAILGIFIAKAYFDTDNIYNSILMHAFHNTFTIAIIFLGGAL